MQLESAIVAVWLAALLALLVRHQSITSPTLFRGSLAAFFAWLGLSILGGLIATAAVGGADPPGSPDVLIQMRKTIGAVVWVNLLQLVLMAVGLPLLVASVWPAPWKEAAAKRVEEGLRTAMKPPPSPPEKPPEGQA